MPSCYRCRRARPGAGAQRTPTATCAQALAAGATSVQEPGEAFHGDRSAVVRDGAGNVWMIATRQENLTDEELFARAREQMP